MESYGNSAFEKHLASLSKWPRRTTPASNGGFRVLASQWQDVNPEQPCCILGYEYLAPYAKYDISRLETEFRGVWAAMTALVRQEPWWARTERRILFREDVNQRLAGIFSPSLSLTGPDH